MTTGSAGADLPLDAMAVAIVVHHTIVHGLPALCRHRLAIERAAAARSYWAREPEPRR